ncbi:hypothetical protein Pmani_021626 [Petrolisthes manimaculis]|uniref:Cuticle protein n=1 Tax=Petrolisthes manimaculis TaxID=1843537 RepID=A0AAE1PG99_9EUCA|nr:hypothetical protein Pmani_021626 [Petrolisthes manimaculis]
MMAGVVCGGYVPPPPPRPPPPPPPPTDIFVPASYEFVYGVEDDPSANNFGHQETRDGDVTRGEYFVKLPDGRIQTVRYTADPVNGFQADISYDGAPLPHQHVPIAHHHHVPPPLHGHGYFPPPPPFGGHLHGHNVY